MTRTWTSASTTYQALEAVSERQFVTVWRVRAADGTERLLEELRLQAVGGWADIDRFERAIALLRTLQHPTIPRLIEQLRTDSNVCLVTESAPGTPIRARLAVATPLAPAAVVDLLRQGLTVLATLHASDPPVLHRDVSPDNVWIHSDVTGATLTLTGFGAAQIGQGSGMSAVGTFGTLAPEQAAGQAVPASDLYGLGMTLLALASQRAPEDLIDSQTGAVQTAGLAGLPERARAVLEAMIVPDLARRLPSAQAGLAVLDERAPVSSVAVKPTGRKVPKWLMALALLLVAVLGYWASGQIPAPGEVSTLGGWFTGHAKWPTAVVFARDKAHLASLGYLDEVIVSTANADIVARANRSRQRTHLTKIAVNAGGDGIAVCGDHDVAVLQLQGETVLEHGAHLPQAHRCRAVHWAQRPLALVGPRRGPQDLVDAATGQVVSLVLMGGEFVWAAALAGDPVVVAVATGADPDGPLPQSMVIHLQDAAGKRSVAVQSVVFDLHLSANGRWLAAELGDSVALIDVAAGSIQSTYPGATVAALSADGQLLALSANGERKNDKPVITVIDRASGQTKATFTGHGRAVKGMGFSSDGKLLATASRDGRVKVWQVP